MTKLKPTCTDELDLTAVRMSRIAFSSAENHWSVNVVGRFVFGALALLAALAFGMFFVVTMFLAPGPTSWTAVAFQGVIGAGLLIGAIFLSLATIHAWFPSQWSTRWLTHYLPSGGLIVVLFVVAVIVRCATVIH